MVDSEDYPDERDIFPEKFDPLHRDHPMFEGWADEDHAGYVNAVKANDTALNEMLRSTGNTPNSTVGIRFFRMLEDDAWHRMVTELVRRMAPEDRWDLLLDVEAQRAETISHAGSAALRMRRMLGLDGE